MNTRYKIKEIKNDTLDQLNIDNSGLYAKYANHILNYRQWFFDKSGKEHYRLLFYISSLYENINILDIGTYKGFSALALSGNKKNKVVSYDIEKQPEINILQHEIKIDNVEFKIGDVLKEDINNYKLIVLDTNHDGVFEKIFIDHLIKIKWSGELIMDDIHHFPELNNVWNSISLDKKDLTHVGHWSGTGIIFFGG